MMAKRRLGVFGSTILTLVSLYVFMKLIFPYLAMWMVGTEYPLPAPSAFMLMYIVLAVIASLVYIYSDDEKIREFWAPVLVLLREDENRRLVQGRKALAVILPLLVGGYLFSQQIPRARPPLESRIQHPTIPGKYKKLVNPYRNPEPSLVRAFMQQRNLQGVSEPQARQMLIQEYIMEGRMLYGKNCVPCHGAKVDGTGPLARGFRLKPANFTDPGMIATLVEAYPFWRILEGGIALPSEASPWDSAMPAWKEQLAEEQIWKIILAEYDLAGMEPRVVGMK